MSILTEKTKATLQLLQSLAADIEQQCEDMQDQQDECENYDPASGEVEPESPDEELWSKLQDAQQACESAIDALEVLV